MQIVIDISEDLYTYMQSRCKYQNKGDKGLSKFEEAGVAIKNGIPLPKGHGRLIDISEYENKYSNIAITFDDANYIYKTYASSIPTIIPAETESEEDE